MIEVTDRHCRAFLRLFSREIRLYSEMIVTGALLYGDTERFIAFNESEHPLAAQLGGSEPDQLANCAKLIEQYGYDEVNMNVGCPSDRVKNGHFGACLMGEPQRVADCVAAMSEAVSIPVTVKTRLGIDDRDSYPELVHFIRLVSESGCRKFIVHARKAWLKGLSPKQNRTLPPLRYDWVYRLKNDFPGLRFILNGEVTSLTQVASHLQQVDGVMIGRAAYHHPWMLREVDPFLARYNGKGDQAGCTPSSRIDIVRAYLPYVEKQLAQGVYLRHMTRHLFGLFHGQPGGRLWRRYLSEHAVDKAAGIEVIEGALRFVGPHRRGIETALHKVGETAAARGRTGLLQGLA